MIIRLKFSKQGQVKFVGHLDMVRLFQRAIKVARIPVAYSSGFSPHSLIYFAMPLSVGVSSVGEYMDIITAEDIRPDKLKEMLSRVLIEEISIIEAFEIQEDTPALMSLVEAADYKIVLPKDQFPKLFKTEIEKKLEKEEILAQKKAKKGGMKEVNIKTMILSSTLEEYNDCFHIHIKVLAGSKTNLSPELFLQALFGEGIKEKLYYIEREELYTSGDQGEWIPLVAYRRK